MKKILITSLFFLVMLGCSKTDINKKIYDEYLEELKMVGIATENLPFDVDIEIEKLESEYIFVASIDNAKEDLNDIEVILMHNYETDDVFPTSGIFEEKLNLIPNKIDEEKNIVKGILLIGYIETENIKDLEFKVLVKANEKKYYYIEKIDSMWQISFLICGTFWVEDKWEG